MGLSVIVFDEKLIEARNLLHSVYLEREEFEKNNSEFVPMEGVNFYIWKSQQERLIEDKAYNCQNYLKWYYLGDFKECERIINLGWSK